MKNKVLCIIQARLGSTRLPGKVLKEVLGRPLLECEIRRIKQAKKIDKIVVATTTNIEDDKIEKLCNKVGIDCFRGSEDDVLDRYYQCSRQYPQYKSIVRITGDCPLVDPLVIDQVISIFEKNNYDFASNLEPPTFPDGMDIEVFKRNILCESAKKAKLPSEREHVDEYMLHHKKFYKGNLLASQDWSHIRLSVDTQRDFEVINFLIEHSKTTAGYLDYILLLTKYPQTLLKNTHFKRNEGLLKSLAKDHLFKAKN